MKLYISSGSIFNFMSWQCCANGLVRFRRKKNLTCVLSEQTQPIHHTDITSKISGFVAAGKLEHFLTSDQKHLVVLRFQSCRLSLGHPLTLISSVTSSSVTTNTTIKRPDVEQKNCQCFGSYRSWNSVSNGGPYLALFPQTGLFIILTSWPKCAVLFL